MRRAIAAIAAAALAACAYLPKPPQDQPATPAPTMVELDNAATGAQVRLAKGGEIKVVLDSNPTTGFQWQAAPKFAPTLSPIGGRAYVAKGSVMGAGGVDIFRYRGEQPGKVALEFEYRRAWETVAPAKTMRYEVTVE
jgi:predicted secreted protein